MRKWMRERMKRRPKPSEKKADSPAPLQPAYFDTEVPAAESRTKQPEPAEATPVEYIEPGNRAEAESEPVPEAAGEQAPKRRRRRGRGGRGGRRTVSKA